MGAAYDTFDYPLYWKGRDYEHKSEVVALRQLLAKIPKINTILEIGAGFGRMIPFYSFRAKKIIVSEPSAKLLSLGKKRFKDKKNITFIQSTISNLNTKIKPRSCDLIIMIRVLHHIEDVDTTFKTISRLLKDNGHFILEFANKEHFKAVFGEIRHGKFDYINNENPVDIRSPKSIKLKTLPFINFHPKYVKRLLKENGMEVVDTLSVSNIRSPFLKGLFATDLLVYIEGLLQKPLSYFNFGPSIFVLARKRG